MDHAAFLVAMLGAATTASFALGLWYPAYLRRRWVKRRLAGFEHAGTPRGLAVDLGGRRQSGAARRTGTAERVPIFLRYLQRLIARARADVTVREIVAAMAILGVLGFAAAAGLMGTLVAGPVGAPLAASLPIVWLRWRYPRLVAKFSGQLSDTIALLAGSVRAGHSLLQALEHVAAEAPEPTKSAFAVVVREIGFGASQDDALERLADRYPSEDLELIVAATNVHQQVGGSLAKILDVIADTIRERVRVAADISALTAQQRISAYVLSALPLFVMIALYLISPDYMGTLFEPGPLRLVVIGAAVMIVLGFLSMRRIASIDV